MSEPAICSVCGELRLIALVGRTWLCADCLAAADRRRQGTSDVAHLLFQAINLRAAAERAGGHCATSSVLECSSEMIEQATPLGQRRLARSGSEEWDVVVLCGGVLTLFGVHRPMDEHARSTTRMAPIAEGEGA